jgi:HAMP domain-containing protein
MAAISASPRATESGGVRPRRAAFLRTRIARRILFSFVLCALLPIVLLAFVAHRQVRSQLRLQSEARLREDAKSAGMALVQRLLVLHAELAVRGQGRVAPEPGAVPAPRSRFTSLRLAALDDPLLQKASERLPRLLSGEPVLYGGVSPAGAVLARNVGSADAPRIVLAEVAPEYLALAAEEVQACFFDDRMAPIACPREHSGLILRALPAEVRYGGRAEFEWSAGDTARIAAAWPVFLGASLGAPPWVAIASETRDAVFAPVRDFEALLLMAFLLALVVVVLLSNIQIRRSLEPVEHLQDGTRRIAGRDFEARVDIRSGDEFEQLGESFNAMAASLSLQFRALAARGELDRAVLSSLDRETVVGAVLERGPQVVPCTGMAVVTIAEERTVAVARIAIGDGPVAEERWRLGRAAATRLAQAPELIATTADLAPLLPAALSDQPDAAHTVLPLRIGGAIEGWIVFRHAAAHAIGEDERSLARDLADQISVALSNAHLVGELDQLRWGALRAFARAIDAKSPWTAGHSERVTSYAMAIGRRLALDARQLDLLQRGGLLHDVGKIGVPAEILDAARKLTPEEWAQMRAHPVIGARIVEPIAEFADVLPMVLYHHEKLDGSGYPEGLSGEGIPYFARILAVADVYDALTSDRPYRAGMDPMDALAIIRRDAGSHFDPDIALTFLEMMAEDPHAAGLLAASSLDASGLP